MAIIENRIVIRPAEIHTVTDSNGAHSPDPGQATEWKNGLDVLGATGWELRSVVVVGVWLVAFLIREV